MDQSEDCVVSLGINSPNPPGHPKVMYQDFPAGLQRLAADLRQNGFRGAIKTWDRIYPPGSPTEVDAHGAFKPFCFYEAIDEGHRHILWLDASMRIKASLDPIFERLSTTGYVLFQESHSVGEYCSDAALATLNITRQESFDMPSCWSCVLGLNIEHAPSLEFLRQWRALAIDGVTFPGAKWSGVLGWPRTGSSDPRVKGHRHDQTAASVIALKLGLNEWLPKETFDDYFINDRQAVRRLREWHS